jgi:hypothetical protein
MGAGLMRDVFSEDLIATVQKRPLLKMLREWRNETESRVEAELLGEVIDAIVSGEFDG